jgi:hypothetical protein
MGPKAISDPISVTTLHAAPSAPSALRTDNVWAQAADVRWQPGGGDITEYRIAVSRDGVNWDNAGVVGANQTSFRLDGLQPNARLWVKVRANGPGRLL